MNKLNVTKKIEYNAMREASTRIIKKLYKYLMDDRYTAIKRLDTLYEIEKSVDGVDNNG